MVYDYDIRMGLFMHLVTLPEYAEDPSTMVVEELDVCAGESRIDVAVVNGAMHGYEIKSERDNLERLPFQVESYNKVFDTISIVLSEKHMSKASAIIPDYWGIYIVDGSPGDIEIFSERESRENENLDPFSLCQLLWKEELIGMLVSAGYKRSIKSKSRETLSNIACDLLPIREIREFARLTLKARANWKARLIQQLCGDSQQ